MKIISLKLGYKTIKATKDNDMRRLLSLLIIWCACMCAGAAQSDSVRVEQLLRAAPSGSGVLWFGRQFICTPYVGHTLEVNATERLVVNLRGLDCTTFVETVTALVLTRAGGGRRYADYCRSLQRIRYAAGAAPSYPARNHYFLWWVESNMAQGIVEPVLRAGQRYVRRQTIQLGYMSAHVDAYKMLRANKAWQAEIATHERASAGTTMLYIPKHELGRSRAALGIADGDILAFATKKLGLDTTHLGFAVWGKDGMLHLLNASSLRGRVVEERETLKQYLAKQKSVIGVWAFRIKS